MFGRKKKKQDADAVSLLQPAEKASLMARLRAYFFTGVIVAMPIWITIYVAMAFVGFVDDAVGALIPIRYNPDNVLPFSVPGLGLIILVLVLTLIGALTANIVGRGVIAAGDRLVNRMPVIRSIYGVLKQIFETILNQKERSFTQACLVEYPRRDLWAIGFVSSRAKGEVSDKLGVDGDPLLNVFVPTTPNPTSGFLLFVRQSDVVMLDMAVEEAAKLVVSAGVVTPESVKAEDGVEPSGQADRK